MLFPDIPMKIQPPESIVAATAPVSAPNFSHQLVLSFSDAGQFVICTTEADVKSLNYPFEKELLEMLHHTPIIVATFRALSELRTVLDYYNDDFAKDTGHAYVYGYPSEEHARMIEGVLKEFKNPRLIYCKDYSYNRLRS